MTTIKIKKGVILRALEQLEMHCLPQLETQFQNPTLAEIYKNEGPKIL